MKSRMIWNCIQWCSVPSVCCDLGNALLEFLCKMGVYSSSWYNHTFLFLPEFTFYSETILWFGVGFFFKKPYWLSQGSQIAPWFTFWQPESLCPFRWCVLSPHECVCVPVPCLCSSGPVTWGSWLLCHNYFKWRRKKESEGESWESKLQDVILKCLLLSNHTSFSAI